MSQAPISVVIAARNEADSMPRLLEALAHQTHSNFEVIVVNDRSTDQTAAIVEAFAEKDPRFRLISIPMDAQSNKKHALTAGIAAANHERLVFTDADCLPPSTWLAAIASEHEAEPDAFFVGYSPMQPESSWLNRCMRYETMFTAFMTGAAIGLDKPYMAVGRNMSYTKSVFAQINGFSGFSKSLSGDDDLMVQAVARQTKIEFVYLLDSQTFVPAEPMHTWKQWFRQKKRHFSAGRFYDTSIQLYLGIFQANSILLWLAPLFMGIEGVGLLILKWIIQSWTLAKANRDFCEKGVLSLLPLLDFSYVLIQLIVAPLGLRRIPSSW
jgi:glycosyltransferase involved in cell wall biosynthesis